LRTATLTIAAHTLIYKCPQFQFMVVHGELVLSQMVVSKIT
jgi:hypothetical protein